MLTVSVKANMGTEEDFVSSVRKGDEDAWEKLYHKLFEPLYRYVYYRVQGNSYDTEDIMQETFLALTQSIETFDPDKGDLYAWVQGIAKQKLAAHYRKKGQRPVSALPPDETLLAQLDRDPLPEETLAQEEFTHLFGTALSDLPPKYQEILKMKYVDELSLQEIANHLYLSLAAVKSLLMRAKEALRESIARYPKEFLED